MPMNKLSRRTLLAGLASTAALSAGPGFALSGNQSEQFVSSLIDEVLRTINSNKSETAMFGDFEQIFARYADVPLIARKALGPAYKTASSAQQQAYIKAFSGYMARFYGKRFEEFLGAEIAVTRSKKAPGGYLVDSTVKLRGSSPFLTQWQVVDARGTPKMYNLFIEGVSILSDVRTQIGAMLDKRGGDVTALTTHLRTAG